MTGTSEGGRARFLGSGEVARSARINPQTLRYYERRGLIPPPARNGARHRLYPPHTVTLIRMIKGAQRLGLTLDEIAQIISSSDATTSIRALARHRVEVIDEQITELETARAALATYLQE